MFTFELRHRRRSGTKPIALRPGFPGGAKSRRLPVLVSRRLVVMHHALSSLGCIFDHSHRRKLVPHAYLLLESTETAGIRVPYLFITVGFVRHHHLRFEVPLVCNPSWNKTRENKSGSTFATVTEGYLAVFDT